MEKVEFLQKQIELAKSSWNSLARLYGFGARVAWFCVPIVSSFPFFFDVLNRAIIQKLVFTRAISKITLSRFDLFFPRSLLIEGEPQREGEHLELEKRTPLFLGMLDAALNQKMRSQVFETPIMPKPIVEMPQTGPPILVEEPEKERGEYSGERTPTVKLFRWQVDFVNRVSPNIGNVLARLDSMKKVPFMSASYATMSAPAVFSLADLRVASHKAIEEVHSEDPHNEKTIHSSVIEEPALETTRKVAAAVQTVAAMAAIVQSYGFNTAINSPNSRASNSNLQNARTCK